MAQQVQKSRSGPIQLRPYSIARMIWKQRALILVIWAAIMIVAAIVISRLPDVYRAEAVVLVDSQKIPEKYVAATVQVSLQDSLSAIGQRVLNVNKLQSVISAFHLYEDEKEKLSPEEMVERLRKDLSVTLERGLSGNRSGAFRISYDGSSPTVVAGVVSRITDLFISENASSREQRAEGTADFIEDQLKGAKQRLDEQEAALSRYKVAHAGMLPQQEAALLGALGRLQADMQGNQDAINRAQQNKILLESTLKLSESALNTTNRMIAAADAAARQPQRTSATGDPAVASPRNSEVLRDRLAAMKLRYLDDHPEVRRLKSELDRSVADESRAAAISRKPEPADAKITAQQTAAPEPRISETSAISLADYNREKERVTSTRAQLEIINREIESRTAARDQIVSSIAEYQKRVESLPIREQQMAALTRDYETSRIAYQSLLDKKLSAKMATDMERSDNSERFTVADPAREPSKPVKPKRLVFLAAAVLAGLAIGLAIALGLELKKDVFLGEWELPQNIRVLGRIPTIQTDTTRVAILGISLLLASSLSHTFLNLTGRLQ